MSYRTFSTVKLPPALVGEITADNMRLIWRHIVQYSKFAVRLHSSLFSFCSRLCDDDINPVDMIPGEERFYDFMDEGDNLMNDEEIWMD